MIPTFRTILEHGLAPAFLALLPVGASATTVVAPATGRLEQALDVIRPDKIRADEFFIASDELGGRDTPSLGQRVAARYIRARLERLSWKPGARDGYFHRYELERRQIDEAGSSLEWRRGEQTGVLRFGADYFIPSVFDMKDLATSGGVVFCGEGGKADFGKASGKWALCFDDGTELRKLRGPARQAGAIGVVLAPGPGYQGAPYGERFARDVERLRRGSVSRRSGKAEPKDGRVRGAGQEETEERKGDAFPALLLDERAASRLLTAAGAPSGGPPAGTDLDLTLAETRRLAGPIEAENVCGFWPGSDPGLAQEAIVLSAHYDHVGTKEGVVFNGADDNGSGTCALMAVAEALAAYGPMRRSVALIWVSGEEKNLWGSAAWTEDPWLPDGARPICNLNLDMVGRNAPDKLLITPTKAHREHNGLVRIAERVAPLEGFPQLGSCDEYWSRSDHRNFAENLHIPVAFLFSDIHEDYHQPGDDPEKVDTDKIARVSRMIVRILEELQADELEL